MSDSRDLYRDGHGFRDTWTRQREREERRQMTCEHVWQHESIIQPGGRGYSTSWCRKCKISAYAYDTRVPQ